KTIAEVRDAVVRAAHARRNHFDPGSASPAADPWPAEKEDEIITAFAYLVGLRAVRKNGGQGKLIRKAGGPRTPDGRAAQVYNVLAKDSAASVQPDANLSRGRVPALIEYAKVVRGRTG